MIAKDRIIEEFAQHGIAINKIRFAGLGDGWYVYHEGARAEIIPNYKRTLYSQTAHSKTYLREKTYKEIRRSFIDDEISLQIAIGEAKNRLGIR